MAFEHPWSIVPSSIWSSIHGWLTPPVLFVLLNLTILTIIISSSKRCQKQGRQQQRRNPPLRGSSSVLYRLRSVEFYPSRSSGTNSAVDSSPESDIDSSGTSSAVDGSPESDIDSSVRSLHERNHLFGSTDTDSLIKTHETKAHVMMKREARLTKTEIQGAEAKRPGDTEPETEEPEEAQGPFGPNKTLDEIYRELKGRELTDGSHAPLKMTFTKSASAKWVSLDHGNDCAETSRPATARDGKGSATEGAADEEVDTKADDFINKFKQQLKLQKLDSIMRYNEITNRGGQK